MDKDAGIDSEYFGLESVSLKNRPEIKVNAPEERQNEEKVQAECARKVERKKRPVVVKVILWIVLLAALFVIGFYVLMNYFPDLLDRLLYSPQELEIIKGNNI